MRSEQGSTAKNKKNLENIQLLQKLTPINSVSNTFQNMSNSLHFKGSNIRLTKNKWGLLGMGGGAGGPLLLFQYFFD